MHTTLQRLRLPRWMGALLAVLIMSQSLLVTSAPVVPARPGITDLALGRSDRYISSISRAAQLSLQLIGPLDTLEKTSPLQLPATFVAQTRQQALELAQQSATAMGTIDALAARIEADGTNSLRRWTSRRR
jgi:hypothetical protein